METAMEREQHKLQNHDWNHRLEMTVELLLQMMVLPAFRIGNSMWYLLDAAV